MRKELWFGFSLMAILIAGMRLHAVAGADDHDRSSWVC